MKTPSLLLSLSLFLPHTILAASGGKQVHAPTNAPGTTVIHSGLSVPTNLSNSMSLQSVSVFPNSLVLGPQSSPAPQLSFTVNPYQESAQSYVYIEQQVHPPHANIEFAAPISEIPGLSPNTAALPPASPDAGLAGVISFLEQLAQTAPGETAVTNSSPLIQAGLQTAHDLVLEAAAKLGAHLRGGTEGARAQAAPHKKGIRASQIKIVTEDPKMLELLDIVRRAAPTTGAALITGESGTGKELFARAFHDLSGREGLFIALNAAGLAESLIEKELFGSVKGAYTGAEHDTQGRFELADGGTLFLDEIGEMPPKLQAKLLRAIEDKKFVPLGGHKEMSSDVRIVAATNVNLAQAMKEGKFRRDLYHRLNVFPIQIPPLRQRKKEDILLLADNFLTHYAEKYGQKKKKLSTEAEELLLAHAWPGNARELQNVMENAAIFAEDTIESKHLRLGLEEPEEHAPPVNPEVLPGYNPGLHLEDLEKLHIARVLMDTGWNKSQAASILNIERSTLDRKIKRYNLKKKP